MSLLADLQINLILQFTAYLIPTCSMFIIHLVVTEYVENYPVEYNGTHPIENVQVGTF